MGNSTKSLASIYDVIAGRGIPDPRQGPAGYGTQLALDIANRVMADIIAERFNWKWNRTASAPFYTNSFQQDYPQQALTKVGWIEEADRVEINNTSTPKPLRQLTARRQLSRCGITYSPVMEICWMYNSQLSFGTWPGAHVVYSPLVATQTVQNPVMSMIDSNGNLLIVTTFGTTGTVAPALPVSSLEGATVTDGTVVWTVVSPNSQGFRIYGLPSATGPVFQITPYYQQIAPQFTTLAQTIDPIPDDYARFFQVGCECFALDASSNPQDRAKFLDKHADWIRSMMDVRKQGDREADAYGMLPAGSPVENIYAWQRDPRDPSQPY